MKLMQRRGLFYPAALGILLLGLLLWFFNRYDLSVQVESAPPAPLPLPDAPANPTPIASPPTVAVEPRPPATPKTPVETAPDTAATPPQEGVRAGKLRVGNPTEHPLRVALLRQLPRPSSSPVPDFDQPVHWDFAPQEGGSTGLLLSLPNGNLEIRDGDILVAFAQDGSGRYWGPYVAGKTPALKWDNPQREWQLILQP